MYLASPFGGRLERLSVRRGDYVEKGGPLFTLEERRLSGLRGRRARRRVEEAKAELEDAKHGL